MIIIQAKLFNKELINAQIEYITKNNIMIYDNLSNINTNNTDVQNILNFEIDWNYDENNYRIPYLNGIKLQQI